MSPGWRATRPKGVTFSDEAVIVENLKPIKAGEGLWQDITGAGSDFGVIVPDEVKQTAGWIGMVERDGKPTVVAVRLQLDPKGSIVQAEHLYADINTATPLGQSQLANLQTVRPGLLADAPEASRKSEDELIRIGASYYDALDDNDGTKMPFAADCERHENGMITAGANAGPGPNGPSPHPIARDCAGQLSSKVMTYITTIGNRRVFAADPVTGLVMGLSHPPDGFPALRSDGDGRDQDHVLDRQPDEVRSVRPAGCARVQGRRRRQGPRDRGDGLSRAAQLAERMGERARGLAFAERRPVAAYLGYIPDTPHSLSLLSECGV
jgi:hypothetical protein